MEASKKINREIELDIMGCDIDGRMVELLRQMLSCGVSKDIHFKQMRRFQEQTRLMRLLFRIQPYGERLSDMSNSLHL